MYVKHPYTLIHYDVRMCVVSVHLKQRRYYHGHSHPYTYTHYICYSYTMLYTNNKLLSFIKRSIENQCYFYRNYKCQVSSLKVTENENTNYFIIVFLTNTKTFTYIQLN